MDENTRQAYDWALNQNYQSVASRYARILANHIKAQPPASSPPIESGWYWYQNPDDYVWEILKIEKERKGFMTISERCIIYIAEWQGRWSGPIKEPS